MRTEQYHQSSTLQLKKQQADDASTKKTVWVRTLRVHILCTGRQAVRYLSGADDVVVTEKMARVTKRIHRQVDLFAT